MKKIKSFILDNINKIGIIILLGVLGLAILMDNIDLSNIDISGKNFYSLVFALTMTITIPFLFKYLNDDIVKQKSTNNTPSESIKNELANIQKTIDYYLKQNPNLLNVERILFNKINSNIEEVMINKLEQRFKEKSNKENLIKSTNALLYPLLKNIENFINQTRKNSIINLLIGIVGSATAILVLFLTIINDVEFESFNHFLVYYIPRVSFSILIQVFSFFFLKLYKNNLDDAKYFQNELTNLTAKVSAIQITQLTNDDEQLKKIILNLSKTERNFKLQNNESTIDIERSKIDSEYNLSLLQRIKELTKNI